MSYFLIAIPIVFCLFFTSLLAAEEGSDLDLDPPKPSEEAEANCTEEPVVEMPVSDSDDQPGNSNCDTECTTQDTMSCAETSDHQVDSIKKLLVDRSKEYNIPQLERL